MTPTGSFSPHPNARRSYEKSTPAIMECVRATPKVRPEKYSKYFSYAFRRPTKLIQTAAPVLSTRIGRNVDERFFNETLGEVTRTVRYLRYICWHDAQWTLLY